MALETLHVEQKHFKDAAACAEYGQAKVAALELDPKTDTVLFGACIKSRVEQVRDL
jgi:hypothetical protein